jgi:hypothetical protein
LPVKLGHCGATGLSRLMAAMFFRDELALIG